MSMAGRQRCARAPGEVAPVEAPGRARRQQYAAGLAGEQHGGEEAVVVQPHARADHRAVVVEPLLRAAQRAA